MEGQHTLGVRYWQEFAPIWLRGVGAALKNWGFIMRRGQVELGQHDFQVIASPMNARRELARP